jgi:hypothetical protein
VKSLPPEVLARAPLLARFAPDQIPTKAIARRYGSLSAHAVAALYEANSNVRSQQCASTLLDTNRFSGAVDPEIGLLEIGLLPERSGYGRMRSQSCRPGDAINSLDRLVRTSDWLCPTATRILKRG